jgi:hypothetical protein
MRSKCGVIIRDSSIGGAPNLSFEEGTAKFVSVNVAVR